MRYAHQTLKDPIWERQDWETNKQWQAFEDFMSLPISLRTVSGLWKIYEKFIENDGTFVPSFLQDPSRGSRFESGYIPPTKSEGTLRQWGNWCGWLERSLAFEQHKTNLIQAKRAEAFDRSLDEKVKTEFDQVEEFRNSMVVIGRSMVSYGSYMMKLLDTTTRVYPLGQALDDRAISKLKDVAFIYRACCTDGIPKGQEVWAEGLGIQQAIDVLAQTEAQESG